ncbi:MAG: hypothetical protein ACOYM9_20855 [Bradymonadia bacterium]
MNTPLRLFTLAALATSTACSSMSSEDVDTDGMYAQIGVEARGNGQTEVRVSLRAGDADSMTWIELDGGDRLYAEREDLRVRLSEYDSTFEQFEYGTALDGEFVGTPVRVELRRERFADADNSVVSLPAPFDLKVGNAGQTFETGVDAVALRWGQGSADTIAVEVEGDCILDYRTSAMPDTGAFELPPQALEAYSGEGEGSTCSAVVRVRRTRVGALDPQFEGGRITASQVREVRIRVVVRGDRSTDAQ